MARIRTVKPELFKHEVLFDLELETGLPIRLAWIGLFTIADRAGRFKYRPRAIKAEVLPFDDVDFARVLDALATRGLIVVYQVDGETYGSIPTWNQHQQINNRETESKLPRPPSTGDPSTRAPRVDDACPTRHDLAQGEGKGREGNGKEIPPTPLAPPSDADPPRSTRGIPPKVVENLVYEHYPRKVGRAKGIAKACKVLKSAQDLEAMVTAVKNFRAQMQLEGRGAEVIPYFSTWVSEQWRDWINPEKSENFAAPGGARGKPPDSGLAEAEKVVAACARWGDHRDDVAAMKAELGPELYQHACRAGLYRIRQLRADGFAAKRCAEMLAQARTVPPAGAADGLTNRESRALMNQLNLEGVE